MPEENTPQTKEDYEIFHQWLVENDKSELLDHFPQRTLRNYANKNGTSITTLPEGKRLRLYEITGLSIFNDNPEYHPNDLDPERIINGEQSRELLRLRIEYDGGNLTKFSKSLGVHKDTLGKYLQNEPVDERHSEKIEQGLRTYLSKDIQEGDSNSKKGIEKVVSQSDPSSNSIAQSLEDINSSLEELKLQIANESSGELKAQLLENSDIPLDRRIRYVTSAIEVLADQMNYFRAADQEERQQLANSLNVDLWGYVAGILPRIDQPSGYDTVLRLMDKPKSKSIKE